MQTFAKATLANQLIRMEPIQRDHIPGLCEAGDFDDVWAYMPVNLVNHQSFEQFIQYASDVYSRGQGLYFVAFEVASDRIVGASGFWNGDLANRRAEIGFTWITPEFQRTFVNTNCKRLLLDYAFETMNLNRVEFKTDALNAQSRAALLRIGAVEEGTLRHHMVMPDGRLRDSVYFSVLKPEWPQVKSRLDAMIGA